MTDNNLDPDKEIQKMDEEFEERLKDDPEYTNTELLFGIAERVLYDVTGEERFNLLVATNEEAYSHTYTIRDLLKFTEPAKLADIDHFVLAFLENFYFIGTAKYKNALNVKTRVVVATKIWCLFYIKDKVFVVDEQQPDLHHTYYFDPDLKALQLCFTVKLREWFETEYRSHNIDEGLLFQLGEGLVVRMLYQTIVRDIYSENPLCKLVKIHKTYYFNDSDEKNPIICIEDRYNGYYLISMNNPPKFYYNGENDIFFEYYKDVRGLSGGYNEKIDISMVNPKKKVEEFEDFRDFLKEYAYDETSLSKQEYVDLIYCNLLSMYFNPKVRPIFDIVGEAGSGKSYLCRNCVQFVTHSKNDVMKIDQNKSESLEVVASANRMFALDNVTHISEDIADSLCTISTGATAGKRELYTTNTLASYNISAFVWLSTTKEDIGMKREDLMERTIYIFLKKGFTLNTKKINADEISIWYRKERYIEMFYMLFIHLEKMLHYIDKIKPYVTSRLDDWSRLMKCASIAIGRTPEYMEDILKKEIISKNQIRGEMDRTVEPLLDAIGTGKLKVNTDYTTQYIYDVLVGLDTEGDLTSGKYGMTPRSLGRGFTTKKDMYQSMGIEVEQRRTGKKRYYYFKVPHVYGGNTYKTQSEIEDDYANNKD